MIADCARFLKPTDSALKKFFGKFSTVDGTDKETQKKYFTLTASPIMEHVLMDVVKGDENAITDNTIDEVYERIRRAEMDVGMRILKNEREKDKMEKAAFRHVKFRQMARPLCCIIWIAAWTVIVVLSASISYCLHCWVEDKSWVGYVVLCVGDIVVLGGDIHEQWIKRMASRISCLIVRRAIRFFMT